MRKYLTLRESVFGQVCAKRYGCTVGLRQAKISTAGMRFIQEHQAYVELRGERGRLKDFDSAFAVDHGELVDLVQEDYRLNTRI